MCFEPEVVVPKKSVRKTKPKAAKKKVAKKAKKVAR